MKELLGAIDAPNMGFLLDSWHSWQWGEDSEADWLELRAEHVVAVDFERRADGDPQRRTKRFPGAKLPCATGIHRCWPVVSTPLTG